MVNAFLVLVLYTQHQHGNIQDQGVSPAPVGRTTWHVALKKDTVAPSAQILLV